MKRYHGHAPGMIYAISIYAKNEQDAREQLRAFLNVKRLPAGAAVWLA